MTPRRSLIASLAMLCLPLIAAAPAPRPPVATPMARPNAPALLNQVDGQALVDTFAPITLPLDFEVEPNLGLFKREKRDGTACLDSSTTAVAINSLLYYGGDNTVVSLCPDAYILLEEPIYFWGANQEISTQGYPTGDSRATLAVNNNTMTFAVYGACDKCQQIALRNVQVYGARDKLGYTNGAALIEFGGNTYGQIIDNCHIYEPRGWSCLHGIEGWNNNCNSMFVTNNQIGPCGNAPNTGVQFKKRDTWTTATSSLTVFNGGEWADGISMACKNSTISGNTITDATDGGIVIFQAPGSKIVGNTIIAKSRVLMGGINAVDFGPFNGGYTDTVVSGNHIISESTMVKVGIAIGGMIWGSDNRTASRTFSGTFSDNTFSSGSTGYFGYAIAMAGHSGATVLGNDATNANFGGAASSQCIFNNDVPGPPTSQGFVFDQWTTPNPLIQNNFQTFPLVFVICKQPGTITGKGVAIPLNPNIVIGASDSTSALASSTTTTVSTTSSSVETSSTTTTDSTTSAVASSVVSSSAVPSSVSASLSPVVANLPKPTTTTTVPSSITKPAATTKTTKGNARASSLAARKSAAKALKLSSRRAAAAAAKKTATNGKREVDGDVLEKRATAAYAKETPALPVGLMNPFAILERERAKARQ